jgi:hypothetical protein
VALATVSVTARQVRFDGIAREAGLLPRVRAVTSIGGVTPAAAWRERQLAWRAVLEQLVADFLAGEARVDPRPGACAWCPVIDICRITEAAADAVAGYGADE